MKIADIKARAEDLADELMADIIRELASLNQQKQWFGVVSALRSLASIVSRAALRFAGYAGVAKRQLNRMEAQHGESETGRPGEDEEAYR